MLMPRPDQQERARRQQLAAKRRHDEELGRVREEEQEQERAAIEDDRWQAEYARQEEARAADAYAERAIKALDELAGLLAECQEEGEDVPADSVREILTAAGHRDFLPDRGWCGTGD
jgi:hypothetical protein